MIFLYIVRCNFTDPAKETAWNAWYSGPKIADMLAKPYFRSCQRFRRASGKGRDYFTLWIVQSPKAFTTAEYTSDWGFFEWEAHITDWSRDLFDALDKGEDAFAVAQSGGLQVITFDGMSVEDALAARAALILPADILWLPVVGLDHHTPLLGLAPLRDLPDSGLPEDEPRVQQAVYRPISELHKAL